MIGSKRARNKHYHDFLTVTCKYQVQVNWSFWNCTTRCHFGSCDLIWFRARDQKQVFSWCLDDNLSKTKLFDIVPQCVFSPKESSDWFAPNKGPKRATLILVKFYFSERKFRLIWTKKGYIDSGEILILCQCNQNSKLYQPWIVCPYLPLLFQGSTLQSYEAVIEDVYWVMGLYIFYFLDLIVWHTLCRCVFF